MKKKFILLLAFWININYICFGQQPPEARAQKVEQIQRTYLTKELSLTPEELAKFFPVYKEYRSEIRSVRKEGKKDELELEEQVLSIRKKYKPQFKTILVSDERVNNIFVAEKNFKDILRKELIKRKMNGE